MGNQISFTLNTIQNTISFSNIMLSKIKDLSIEFSKEVSRLSFSEPVEFVYNPLEYARKGYFRYLDLAIHNKKKVIFLGMNPGPWGMAQTGVPFGEINIINNWMKINTLIDKPENEHPKRQISGFDCKRSEVSGRRLWGFFKEQYKTPDMFFLDNFVANYCPLVFMENSGKNRTPDKLRKEEKNKLYKICDKHLFDIVRILKPEWLIGIGGFAEKRIKEALNGSDIKIGKILHPSPASPMANRGWAEIAKKQLNDLGIV